MREKYNLLIDLYPLLEMFPPESSLLVMRIEHTAFSALTSKKKKLLYELILLLQIAKDLGYIESRVFSFLRNKIEELC